MGIYAVGKMAFLGRCTVSSLGVGSSKETERNLVRFSIKNRGMNVQLLMDACSLYNELQLRTLLQVSILREFTVLLLLAHSLFILCRCQIFKDCIPVVEKANSVIHSSLDDPDIPLSPNELRWLGCNVYNLGCVSYQRDCFTEGVPLLAIACEELRVWCFAGKTDEEILTRIVEVIWP